VSGPLSAAELRELIGALPRVRLAHLPTPLEPLPATGARLEVGDLLVKRDDATGLGLGGNKARMFEYVLGDALDRGADAVLGGAMVPANYCRQLAAGCARAGLELHMVLGARPESTRAGRHDEAMAFFPRLFGARVSMVDPDWRAVDARLDEVEEELRAQGRTVARLQAGQPERDRLWTQSFGLHAVGYVAAFLELADQLEARGTFPRELWLCSSEATQAGLCLAARALGSDCRIVGVSPVVSEEPGGGWSADIAAIANEAAAILGLDVTVQPDDVDNRAGYDSADEGEVTGESLDAVRRLAAEDGLLLDPVYTGKAMAALLREAGGDGGPGAVVFLHTGGLPATMSFREELEAAELHDRGGA
jgi:L-cysteate sulfo-lyase